MDFTFSEIYTKRLYLRPLEEGDAIDMYHYMMDIETLRYLSYTPHKSVEETLNFLKTELLCYEQHQDFMPMAILLEEKDCLIGHIQLHTYRENSAQLCYLLHKDAWHKGYAREVLEAMLDRALYEKHLLYVDAVYDVENLASERLLTACGFHKQKQMERYFQKFGLYRDVILARKYKGEETI